MTLAALKACYFCSSLQAFAGISDAEILAKLLSSSQAVYGELAGEAQVAAWKDELQVLRPVLAALPPEWAVVFEYLLPRERGRRPDVVLLTESAVLVLEFKQASAPRPAYLDQVIGYTRDLRDYQAYCSDKRVVPLLVLTRGTALQQTCDGVVTVSPDMLTAALRAVSAETAGAMADSSKAMPAAATTNANRNDASATASGAMPAAPTINADSNDTGAASAATAAGAPHSGAASATPRVFTSAIAATAASDAVQATTALAASGAMPAPASAVSRAAATRAEAFLTADYQPLPSILQAAERFFRHEPLPQLKSAKSAGIDKALLCMQRATDAALSSGENLLVLLTGVPGAGKTLAGLQFAFNNTQASQQRALMLSGNGPLVRVLQYVLKNRHLVTDVHGFLQTYGGSSSAIPNESIIIYDEAQRAWDEAMARERRGAAARAEPCELLQLAHKKHGLVIVALIGEGQEINRGEEAGIAQWKCAITQSGAHWRVLCPERLSAHFSETGAVTVADALNLTLSLRSKSALQLPAWVSAVLDGDSARAKALSENGLFAAFPVYLSQTPARIKDYVRSRYEGEKEKRYGLLASSKARNLTRYKVPNDYEATRAVNVGAWYADDASSALSCCQLKSCVTEFSAQGLELDLPIVAWGDDFIRKDGSWKLTAKSGAQVHDPYRLRQNCYRVLLTRGREGMCIFVPPEPTLQETYRFLVACGCKILPQNA